MGAERLHVVRANENKVVRSGVVARAHLRRALQLQQQHCCTAAWLACLNDSPASAELSASSARGEPALAASTMCQEYLRKKAGLRQ